MRAYVCVAFCVGFLCGTSFPQEGLLFTSVKKPVIVMSKQASTDSGGEGNGVLEEVVPKDSYSAQGLANDKVSYAIVLTTPISGSEFTVDQLDRIPGVEFFGDTHIFNEFTRLSGLERDKFLSLTWETYLNRMLSAFPTPKENTKYIGVKMMYNQIPPQLMKNFASWLNEEQVTVIHLRRLTAAIQFESQVSKIQRVILSKGTDKHIGHCHVGTGCNRTKTAKVEFGDSSVCPNWEMQVRTLEENQDYFTDYLRVHASMAPTLEVIYEDLSGPYGDRYLDGVAAFMGFGNVERGQQTEKSPVKAGKLTCEDRIDGLGGPEYPLLANFHRSRVMCLSLSNQVNRRIESNTNLFLPDDTPRRYSFYGVAKEGASACAQKMAARIAGV